MLLAGAGQVVGRGLVDVVVEPVGVEQLSLAAPDVARLGRGVVIREVMRRNLGAEPALHVALVLQAQRVGIVLGMAKDKEATAVGRLDDVQANLVRHGHNLKLRLGLHVLAAHIGVARMHGIETVVKAADQRALQLHQIMLKYATRLCR